MPKPGSLSALILEAASTFPGWFSAEDLAVVAWRLWPQRFGLNGYVMEHPDFHAVYALLCGRKGLVGQGWLEKYGKHYLVAQRAGTQMRGPATLTVNGEVIG